MFQRKATAAALSAVVFLVVPGASARASHLIHFADADRVTIDPVSATGCGSQSVTIQGTAEYAIGPHDDLVVAIDGREILRGDNEPESWRAGPMFVTEGTHTVTAMIFEDDVVTAQDALTFTVPSCAQPQPSGAGGPPDSSDCCPGPDPVTPKPAIKKGTVKGIAVRAPALPGKLAPLNGIFRKVHGRTPTFQEWSYWADRLLTDKPQFDALYGAIQWHDLRGRTVGT